MPTAWQREGKMDHFDSWSAAPRPPHSTTPALRRAGRFLQPACRTMAPIVHLRDDAPPHVQAKTSGIQQDRFSLVRSIQG